MPETLQDVGEDDPGTESDTHGLDSFEHGSDNVGTRCKGARRSANSSRKKGRGRTLKDVGPDQVEEMLVRILVPKSSGPEREMLDDRSGRLAMNEVSVGEGVLEAGDDGVDVVLAHLANVLEEERHGLETTVANVELGRAILVENSGDAGEGSASLGDDSCARKPG